MVSEFFRSGQTPNIGVVINPLSGGNRNGLEVVRSIINDQPQVVHCDVQTPEDVQDGLADFARQKVNLVAVNGGPVLIILQMLLTVPSKYARL